MPARTPAEILKRIRKIEIQTRNIVSEIFRGEYHSSFKGQGLEFAEVREYQPGDNYRDIDWNVSARLGIPYVKKFRETRELNVMFIVDVSASQNFGTRVMLKKERLAEIIEQLSRYERLLWRNVNPKVVWDNAAITLATGAPLRV